MQVYTEEICLESSEKTDIIDVTNNVKEIINHSKIRDGIVNVYTTHTTTAIRINENETGLMKDIKFFLDKSAPTYKQYEHDDFDKRVNIPVDEPANAHSHLKSFIMGASETIPLINSNITLGKWQSIFFVDLDGPRKRKMYIHVVGVKK